MSCKVADIYDEFTLNDILIKDMDPYLYHSPWKYWSTHEHLTVIDIDFKSNCN